MPLPMPNITIAILRSWYNGESNRIANDNTPIASLSFAQKLERALIRAFELLPAKTAAAIRQMYPSPEMAAAAAAGAAVAVATALGASYLTCAPVGVCLTLILIFAGFAATGFSCFQAAWELGNGLYKVSKATNKFEIDAAAKHFADAMVYIGPELVMMVLTEGFSSDIAACREAVQVAKTARAIALANKATRAGMMVSHLEAFLKCARDMNRVIILRNTKEVCLKWIERGFPGKPAFIKIKNDPATGLVTFSRALAGALFDAEGKFVLPTYVADSEMAQLIRGMDKGDWIVGPDYVARNSKGEVFMGAMDWDVQPGQLISREFKKPYTGDYDLLDVLDLSNPSKLGVIENMYYAWDITNITTGTITDLMFRMRSLIGESRIMHGPWNLFYDVEAAGECTLIFPNGNIVQWSAMQVRDWYVKIGRPILPPVEKLP